MFKNKYLQATTSMEIPTLPIKYINSILTAAESKGFDRGEILTAAGVAPAMLASDINRVPSATFTKLTATVAFMLEDEALGFLDTRLKPGSFAMMCHACISSSSLRKLMQRWAKFYQIVTDDFTMELVEEGDWARFTLTAHEGMRDPENYLTQSFLGIMHRTASWFIDKTVVLDHANFIYPRPSHANEYNFLFSSPVKFSQQENSIVFSSKYLDAPIVQDQRSLKIFLASAPMGLMSSPDNDNSLVTKIRRLIRNNVADEFPEFEEVAKQLFFTGATLRRRLRDEGSSYQQIKDDIRRDTAIHLLARGDTVIEDIAMQVGFSEATSFFRAFKRWTGVTPRAYLDGAEN